MPAFDVRVEPISRVELRVHLPLPDAPGSELSERLVSDVLAWFGDQYLAHPQLDDLLRLSVHRIGFAEGAVFDSSRDHVELLRQPHYVLSLVQATGTQAYSPAHSLDLFLQPAVGQPYPLHSLLDGARVVWVIGPIAEGVLPSLHALWQTTRTVVDLSPNSALLLRVCANLVRALNGGLGDGIEGWVWSPAVSNILEGTGYAVS